MEGGRRRSSRRAPRESWSVKAKPSSPFLLRTLQRSLREHRPSYEWEVWTCRSRRGVYLTLVPGSTGLSGTIRESSSSLSPAARIIPSDSAPKIFFFSRLATSTTLFPTSSSGA